MLHNYLLWSDPETLALLQESLNRGHVSITSSDTVLGFLAALSPEGYAMLDSLKQRSNKPYLIIMGSTDKLGYFTDQTLNPGLQRLIDASWPGPVTLIFRAKASLPFYMKGSDGTIAVRVPDHKGLLALLKNFPGLFSTSANLHGQPIPQLVNDIDPQVVQSVDYVVSDEQVGLEKENKPSTILDCTGDQIRVIRKGAFDIDLLEGFAGQVFKKD